jgi:GNAT superfamily N-acetyltransferase
MVVGWIHALDRELLQSRPTVEIGGLVVSESFRGLGVGRKLMNAVTDWTRERGHATLWVLAGSVRVDTHSFYESIGFDLLKTSMTFVRPVGRAL